nr:hypothetical protein [Microcystis sp. M090S1]
MLGKAWSVSHSSAYRYKVSREVVLRKLLDNNLISQKEYTLKVNEWYSEQVGKSQDKNQKSGGDYYANQATYLGENYLKLVFNKYYSGKRLSEIQTKLCLAWFIARDTVPHTTAHRYIKANTILSALLII